MPNIIDATGLTTATTDEIATDLALALSAPSVYGAGINTDPESPDGQMIGIFSQADSDLLDLQVDIYNTFDVDAAYGIGLQRLVALNGLTIKPGTFTITPVSITSDKAITLPGIDQTVVPPYQVRDPNTLWTLVSSFSFGAPGTQALVFQAASMGPITPIVNTITIQATPLNGITGVNNPTVAGAVIGVEEETDVALRIRHAEMFQLAATGPADAVEAALQSLADVTDALVVENKTGGTVNGVPAHSLWCIVVGGTGTEIARAIYVKSSCAGLFGAQTVNVIRPNGQSSPINYDIGLPQRLWTEFGIVPAVVGLTFDNTLLKQELAAAMLGYFKLGKTASIGDVVRAMFKIEPRAILVAAGMSTDGGSFSDTVGTTSSKFFFTLAAGDIDIT